jgi:hypothetical protein
MLILALPEGRDFEFSPHVPGTRNFPVYCLTHAALVNAMRPRLTVSSCLHFVPRSCTERAHLTRAKLAA